MLLKHDIGIQGKITVCKKINEVDVPCLPEFNNLILDTFINAIYAGQGTNFSDLGGTFSGIGVGTRVGTGTNAPDVTDTALVNPVLVSNGIATVTNSIVYDAVDDVYIMTRTTRTEYSPSASSYNLSEIGIYTNSSANPSTSAPMVSRSLIKDGLGNPTTITLAVGEILVIFYTFVVKVPVTLQTSAVIKGVTTDLEFKLHFSSTTYINNFPFRAGFVLGPIGSHCSAITTNFTFATPLTELSKTGWNHYPDSVSTQTPTNPAVGFKTRGRVNLSTAVLNGIVGFAWSFNSTNFWRSTILKATPAFNKTSQDVLDFETITTYTRL